MASSTSSAPRARRMPPRPLTPKGKPHPAPTMSSFIVLCSPAAPCSVLVELNHAALHAADALRLDRCHGATNLGIGIGLEVEVCIGLKRGVSIGLDVAVA